MKHIENNQYLRRLQGLRQERNSWESHWQEISDYILPRKGIYSGHRPNDGRVRSGKIIDSTATRALRILAAGLQGGPDLSGKAVVQAWYFRSRSLAA